MEDMYEKELECVFKALTKNVISPDSLKFAESGTMNTIINDAWGFLFLVGLSFTLVHFLIELNMKFAMEGSNVTMKTFIAPFAKLTLAVGILSNGGTIMNQVLGANNAFIDAAANNFAATAPDDDGGDDGGDDAEFGENQPLYDAFKDNFKSFGMVQQIIIIIFMALVWIITLVMGVVWYYKALMYKLELVYRLCITPVAFADVYSGNNTNAIRWIKGTFALGLYAGAILLVPKLGNMISVTGLGTIEITDALSVWELFKQLVTLLVMPFACLGVMSTIKQVCKEVVA